MFDINYTKNNNTELFKSLEDNDVMKPQNYIPLYKNFFDLSSHNFNKINLNQHFKLENVESFDNKNKFKCKILSNGKITEKISFFKFSPLLDPTKFMVGKYQNLSQEQLTSLPTFDNNICHKKLLNIHNTAYVDSFFSYLSSKVLLEHKVLHGIDFYGSFLGIKENFSINIYDDLEYLTDSTFFTENCNKLFKIENIENIYYNNSTRTNLKRLDMTNSENVILNLDEIKSEDFDTVFQSCTLSNPSDYSANIIFEYDNQKGGNAKKSSIKSSLSECSSNSSHTSHDSQSRSQIDSDIDSEFPSDEEDEKDEEDEEEEYIEAKLFNFPVQIISLENLDNTLDSFLTNDSHLSDDEWCSCLFQIIMTLIIYQHMFDFTHNDLHTSNIMFKKTDKQYLYYKYDKIHYKVPTFGKIWKIIDFGRAIYKFKGKRLCSDSFHKSGDAASQYNCEPFLNKNKPRLEPNKSFDLCRLGCSLFDYFEDNDEYEKSDVAKLITNWCKDDKDRNILYKTNGDERYPEFKLYKMIVRTVHRYTPQKQIKEHLFKKFQTNKKKINNKTNILNVDNLPSYVN